MLLLAVLVAVFPTHVGVFPSSAPTMFVSRGLPHARGGVSSREAAGHDVGGSSPRTWGCFSIALPYIFSQIVFPTHVGVFLTRGMNAHEWTCLPHARGGVSPQKRLQKKSIKSSPRTWGCFSPQIQRGSSYRVFPTHVGVFPT